VILHDKVIQLSTNFWSFVGKVGTIQSATAGIPTLSEELSAEKMEIAQKLSDPVVEQLSMKMSELRKEVLSLKAEITTMPLTVTPSQNHPAVRLLNSVRKSLRTVSDGVCSQKVRLKKCWDIIINQYY
jgi:hypothetical protein